MKPYDKQELEAGISYLIRVTEKVSDEDDADTQIVHLWRALNDLVHIVESLVMDVDDK